MNNYKVPGKKMTSRFGLSHSALREMNKREYEWISGEELERRNPSAPVMSKRLAKKCKHPRMIDEGYGGPEGGCMAGHCPDCGYSFSHRLY